MIGITTRNNTTNRSYFFVQIRPFRYQTYAGYAIEWYGPASFMGLGKRLCVRIDGEFIDVVMGITEPRMFVEYGTHNEIL